MIVFMSIILVDPNFSEYLFGSKTLSASITENRKVLTETGSRTTGLLFNVQVLYQLSYHDPTILLSRFGSRPNYPSVVCSGVVANKQELERSKISAWYYFHNVNINIQLHRVFSLVRERADNLSLMKKTLFLHSFYEITK